jgi:hypothetical protein
LVAMLQTPVHKGVSPGLAHTDFKPDCVLGACNMRPEPHRAERSG